MVCRSTPGNSAMTTLARINSGLNDVQVLSLFHEIRADAPRTAEAPSNHERDGFLGRVGATVVEAPNLSASRRSSLVTRLQSARAVPVDGRTYYAWATISSRAAMAAEAMNAHYAEISRLHECSPENVRAAFDVLVARDHRINGNQPEAPEHIGFSTDNLPRDRRTRYALAMLYRNGPGVIRGPRTLAAGYQRVLEDSENRALTADSDPAHHCPDCGQFAGRDHACPPDAAIDAAATLSTQGLVAAADNATSTAPEPNPAETTVYDVALPLDANGNPRLRTHGDYVAAARDAVVPTPVGWTTLDGGTTRETVEEALNVSIDVLRREDTIAIIGAHLGATDARRWLRDTAAEVVYQSEPGAYRRADATGMYTTFEHAALAAWNDHLAANRCPGCGQYAAADHTCPTPLTPDTPTRLRTAEEYRNAAEDRIEPLGGSLFRTPGGLVTANRAEAASRAETDMRVDDLRTIIANDHPDGLGINRIIRNLRSQITNPHGNDFTDSLGGVHPTEEHALLAQYRINQAILAALDAPTSPPAAETPPDDAFLYASPPTPTVTGEALDAAEAFYASHCMDCGQYLSSDTVHICEMTPTVAFPEANRPAPATVVTAARRDLQPASTYDLQARNNVGYPNGSDGTYYTSAGRRRGSQHAAVTDEARDLRQRALARCLRSYLTEDETLDFREYAATQISTADGGFQAPGRPVFPTREHAEMDLFWSQTTFPAGNRCEHCGQFAAADHVCAPAADVSTPAEAQAAHEEALADLRARLTGEPDFADPHDPVTPDACAEEIRVYGNCSHGGGFPGAPTDDDLEAADAAPPQPARRVVPRRPAATNSTTRQRTPLRTYPGPLGSVRMTNLSQIRADLRRDQHITLNDVQISISETDPDTGTTRSAVVTGSITATDSGRRRTAYRDRVTVEPAAERSLRCTCPDYRARYDCIHVRQATEQVQAILNSREPVAVAPAAAVANAAAGLRDEFDASLAAQQQARATFAATENGPSYAEDMDAFQTSWDAARTHFESGATSLPYLTENATGGLGARGTGRSFGIEIEVDFPDSVDYTEKEAVAREIYEAGLSRTPHVQGWHYIGRAGGGYTDAANNWSVEFDRSVDGMDGRRGCEIVSPILYDEPHTWENLKKVCDIVEAHGGKVTPRTGLHINVGAADFDHTVENHNRLLGLANGFEDVIVRTAHNPASGARHRGRDYCRPMDVPASGYRSISQAQRSIDPQSPDQRSHRAMINLDHVPAEGQPVTSSTRVEVRIFDGSVDPGRIQANVKLSLGLVNAAARGADVPATPERAGTHRTANRGETGRPRRLRGEDWQRDTESFRRFADTLFSRAEDKAQLTYLFAASRWQAR